MRKKILATALVATMVFGLVGCGSGSGDSSQASNSGSDSSAKTQTEEFNPDTVEDSMTIEEIRQNLGDEVKVKGGLQLGAIAKSFSNEFWRNFKNGYEAAEKSLKDAGLKLVIISNTNNLRARIISREFSIKCFALARKPSPKKIIAGLNYTGVSPDRFAFIGDQLFYDIAAANRAGVVSIKVDPTAPEILFASKFRRRREKEREFMELYKDEYPEMRGLNDEY